MQPKIFTNIRFILLLFIANSNEVSAQIINIQHIRQNRKPPILCYLCCYRPIKLGYSIADLPNSFYT